MLETIGAAIGSVTHAIDAKLSYILIPALLGTGLFYTLRLGFLQIRKLGHGILVTSGKLDPDGHTGDVSHFQALTTALSATVGVGNIAGVAMAIHFGGPGAVLWMWVTAFFGAALKYAECTLAVKYRDVLGDEDDGEVSGGPMYYISKGLNMPKLAAFFAIGLMTASFFTGNAIQANTLADVVSSDLGVPTHITGLISAALVALVILGGIKRIAKVTSILAPAMALLYVGAALVILYFNSESILPSLKSIFVGAFTPVAGVTGVGAGSILTVLNWGVKRGLYSNEAGQGSAPVAHAAARTEEPVSEGVVALLEPFIDTIIICTITALVILSTNAWDTRFPTELEVGSIGLPSQSVVVADGQLAQGDLIYNHGTLPQLFVDAEHKVAFQGALASNDNGVTVATAIDGTTASTLYGDAVDLGAPLTARAFKMGLSPLIDWGNMIVAFCVVLFALSTAISWSYYGDRCVMYLVGHKGILPYKLVFIAFHFIGATASVTGIWSLGDVALALCTLPNILGLILLSGQVKKITDTYFNEKPWLRNKA